MEQQAFNFEPNALPPIRLEKLPDSFKLRDVQEKGINMLLDSFKTGIRRVVMHMGTGGGKTILAGIVFHMMFRKNPCQQVIFVVPRVTLLKQTKKVFEDVFGYDCGIIQSNKQLELYKHVQVATIQTLNNRLNSSRAVTFLAFQELNIVTVVVDEAHLLFKGVETVKEKWNPFMIGLTATPFSKGMGVFWQGVVRPKSMAGLIEDGTLSKYKVFACQPIDRENLQRMSTGEYRDKEVDEEVEKIIGDVYLEWKKNPDMQGRPFLLFTKSIKSCIAIAEHFSNNGVSIGYVHSKMSEEDIQHELDAFRAGHFVGMVSVVMLIEGFDYPEVSAMIDCAPLAPSKSDPNIPNSCNRYVQKIGRCLRSAPGKDYALVHDHSGNFINYGDYEFIEELFPGLDDGIKKDKTLTPDERIKRTVRECKVCGFIVKTNKCPQCRTETKRPTQFLLAGDIVFEDGQMVEMKPSGLPATAKYKTKNMTSEERMKFAGELKGYIEHRRLSGKSLNNETGYYAHKYRERTGKWPGTGCRFDDVKSTAPTHGFMSWVAALQRQYFNKIKGK